MQTERVYYNAAAWKAPFAASITAVRTADGGGAGGVVEVILDRTIFYPEGGGQSGDRGTINGFPVLDVQERGGEIVHILSASDGAQLREGAVSAAIDVARRRDMTVLHTAQHLLSGTILRLTGKPTVSMHLGEDLCTVDVNTPDFSEDTLIMIEEAAADAIEEDSPVIIHRCPPEDVNDFPLRKVPPQGEEVIRVVEIRGHDFSPCCGTHTESTGQIGMLRILGAEKYKGMMRVTFIAGRRVLRDSRMLRKNADVVSRSLKVPVMETGQAVLSFLERTGQLERRVRMLEETIAQGTADVLLERLTGLEGSGKAIFAECLDADIDAVLRIGKLVQKGSKAVVVLASKQDLKFAAFCSEKTADVRGIVKNVMEAYGGRGGGGPSFFQGMFSSRENLDAFMHVLER
jgi:alanyl-tRNA synthetase